MPCIAYEQQEYWGASQMSIWAAVEQEGLAAIEAYAVRGGELEVGKSLYRKTPLLYALQLKKRKSCEMLLTLGALAALL